MQRLRSLDNCADNGDEHDGILQEICKNLFFLWSVRTPCTSNALYLTRQYDVSGQKCTHGTVGHACWISKVVRARLPSGLRGLQPFTLDRSTKARTVMVKGTRSCRAVTPTIVPCESLSCVFSVLPSSNFIAKIFRCTEVENCMDATSWHSRCDNSHRDGDSSGLKLWQSCYRGGGDSDCRYATAYINQQTYSASMEAFLGRCYCVPLCRHGVVPGNISVIL